MLSIARSGSKNRYEDLIPLLSFLYGCLFFRHSPRQIRFLSLYLANSDMSRLLLCLTLVSVLVASVLCEVYIPGVTPSAWDEGDKVLLKANKISSTESPVVYDYYDMPFCKRSSRSKVHR